MRRLIGLAFLAIVAASCAEAPEAAGGALERAQVATAQTALGEVLVTGEGMTLYLFAVDGGTESSCYDECAQTWPPLLTEGTPQAQGTADPSLFGTTTREDGSTQVTYGGHPLYLYAQDSDPGDTNGQGVDGIWWVVSPGGEGVSGSAGEAPADTPAEQPTDDYDY
ncbi:MAG: COG4315 family predicted lipoprotein [Acidimicrobiia bacterium]